jgi:hypothetical protein
MASVSAPAAPICQFWRWVWQAGRGCWDDAAMADRVEPFMIGVDSAGLGDLRDRLRRARWPER